MDIYTPGTQGNIASLSSTPNYLASGGSLGSSQESPYEAIIRIFGFIPHNCCITQSLVTNSTTSARTGVGISANNVVNYVAKNSACFNDVNYDNSVNPALIQTQTNATSAENVTNDAY